jgi:spermidine synthase
MGAARASVLAFVVAFVTLFVQVLAHRMVSAKLINNFAFLIVSMTMLGFALSGVALTAWREPLMARRRSTVFWSSILFGLTLVLAMVLFYRAPTGENWMGSTAGFVAAFVYCVPLALLFAIPFAFCGLILGILLSSPDLPTRRVYFWDLLGSAFGAILVIPGISLLGAERGALIAALALVVSGVLLCWPRSKLAYGSSLVMAVSLMVLLPRADRIFEMTYPRDSFLGLAQTPNSGYSVERIEWDPVARIELLNVPPPHPQQSMWPAMVGSNPGLLSRFTRLFSQNNNACTYAMAWDGTLESLDGVEETIYSAAYEAMTVPSPEVLVIGVGGGFDILVALRYGASTVTGIEVNAATVRLVSDFYRDDFQAWLDDPRVRLVLAEGRQYLVTHPGRHDLLQLSGVDSASGTPAAAHIFVENYLYTEEAFDLYLSRLSERGVLSMIRTEYRPPREMLRALVTAVGALRRAHVARPREHIVVIETNRRNLTALLVKRTPFEPAEVERLARWASGNPLVELAAAPGYEAQDNAYQWFLSLGTQRRERLAVAQYPFDIRPTNDDRPFFFRFSYWKHLFDDSPLMKTNVPVMEYALILLLGITGLAAVGGVFVPLRFLARDGLRMSGTARYAVFFSGIGLGFMGLEIALLQKYGLFLGHPNYAVSVVLAALLMASGLGSLVSATTVRWLGGLRYLAYVLALVVLVEHQLILPALPTWMVLPFAVRAVIVALLVLPVGLCLGAFFPSALEQLKGRAPAFVPWAWGLIGDFSVIGPVLAVGVSMTWGISLLLLSTLPIYLVASWALPTSSRDPALNSARTGT